MTTTPDSISRFADSEVRRISIAGIPIAYRDIGAGPTVLLLHGWPTDGRTFAPLVEALADRYHFVIPDLPGAGATPWSRKHDLSPAGQARIIEQFVEQLGIDHGLTIVGSDSGGMVARWFTSTAGSLVSGLVLLNTEIPGHRAPFQRRSRLLARWLTGYTTIAMKQLRRPRFLASRAGFGGTLYDHDLLLGSFRERFLEPLAASHARMDDARRSFISVLDWKQLDRLGAVHTRIMAPTWFIWGRDDLTFPIAHGKRMYHQFPNARGFITIERARLYVHEDRPDEVIRSLQSVLTELQR
jgi:haloalkane dehalogenase